MVAVRKSVTVQDHKAATVVDLGTQFFLSEESIGQNRAVATASRLAELNPYVDIDTRTEELTATCDLGWMGSFGCVIVSLTTLILRSLVCHRK